ncbi:ABC transporter permease [Oerskovia sp. NPDC060338]|uniref:ABC transporter permease n=1 Tax=unclassified Oerskovia TaxID=2619021 RepID=UPI00366529DD
MTDQTATGPVAERPAPTDGASPADGAAPAWRRVASQTAFETRMILRNGEQLLVTIILPVMLLVGLARTSFIDLDTQGHSRIDFVTPGVLALAVMSTAFTSQAIATAFDRRNGVLRLLSTTPLGRGGLLAGKILGVLAVEVVQVVVLGGVALALGWSPDPAGILPALLAVLLGTAAFTSLALLLAGTLRAEGVLAVANLLLVLLTVAGGVLVPVEQLPGALEQVALLLPSGALGEAMRGALLLGEVPAFSVVVLLGWTAALGWGAGKLFRWH